jgi:hypothetical protein
MATSEVAICNLALTKLGQEQILALTENSKAGRLCNLHYAHTRDALLRDHLWNFAIKRVELALSTTTPAFDFAYQHTLPSDLLRLLTTNLTRDAEFKVEGEFLMSDSSSVKIKYIAQITDVGLFDQLYIEALSARLAAELAIPLTDSKALAELMFGLYHDKMRSARSVDAMEGTPDNIKADAWLDARLGYVSPYNA